MRQQEFLEQLTLDCIPIADVKIPTNARSHMDKLLTAIQHIYLTPKWSKLIFELLEKKILKDKNKTGRPGMSLWEIFVLSQVKLCMNISYDELHHQANCNSRLRGVMGVLQKNYNFGREKEYGHQNIFDNVNLLDEDFLKEINDIIVQIGNGVFKKKNSPLCLKTDSFVVETETHFPTDYNLLFDSVRKSIETIKKLNIPGWRKSKSWIKSLKGLMRELGKISSNGGKNKTKRLEQAVKKYLQKGKVLIRKIQETLKYDYKTMKELELLLDLSYYNKMLKKHIDLVERRLLKEEKIPHSEKIFSIFQPFVEMIKKGKTRPNVEIGKKVVITTDQNNLIVDWQISEKESDSEMLIPIIDRLLAKYNIEILSVDKGFSSKTNKKLLELYIKKVVMPKKGKLNKQEKEEESNYMFKKIKNKHSAIESNINELEHRGLNRCPNRSYKSFKSYVGLACTAYNLHKIGKEIQKQNREKLLKESLKQRA